MEQALLADRIAVLELELSQAKKLIEKHERIEREFAATGVDEARAALGFLEDNGFRFEDRNVAITDVRELLDIHLRSVEIRAVAYASRVRALRAQNEQALSDDSDGYLE